jgi:hypothetical protein
MDADLATNAPKPFVFVLMPFTTEFTDTYHRGIKAAAEQSGAHAERRPETAAGSAESLEVALL